MTVAVGGALDTNTFEKSSYRLTQIIVNPLPHTDTF